MSWHSGDSREPGAARERAGGARFHRQPEAHSIVPAGIPRDRGQPNPFSAPFRVLYRLDRSRARLAEPPAKLVSRAWSRSRQAWHHGAETTQLLRSPAHLPLAAPPAGCGRSRSLRSAPLPHGRGQSKNARAQGLPPSQSTALPPTANRAGAQLNRLNQASIQHRTRNEPVQLNQVLPMGNNEPPP